MYSFILIQIYMATEYAFIIRKRSYRKIEEMDRGDL